MDDKIRAACNETNRALGALFLSVSALSDCLNYGSPELDQPLSDFDGLIVDIVAELESLADRIRSERAERVVGALQAAEAAKSQ